MSSTRTAQNAIMRGKTLTGRTLRDLLTPDQRATRVGRGLRVRRNNKGQQVITMRRQRNRTSDPVQQAPPVYGRITGSTVIVAPGSNRWTYDLEQVQLTEYATVTWDPVSPPNPFQALNLAEVHNDGFGEEGSGVDITNLLGTFSIRPIMNGSIVECFFLATATDAGYFFDRVNAIDGTCP